MADSDIFVSNDIQLDVDFGTMYIVDQGVVIKVVADRYNATKTYSVGEYAIQGDILYKCIVAIEEPEEFDSEKWQAVKIASELEVINATLPTKADANTVYTKSEIENKVSTLNNAIALKANASDVYTKSETYNQTEVDTALGQKADASSVYTKEEIDNTVEDIADSITDLETVVNTKADDSAVYKKDETYNQTQVNNIINNLPTPMIFKGTLGTNGTISDLPGASSDNEGFTYKVITDGTYASTQAKVGDMFTSNGSAWVHIPSGDETFTDTWRSVKVNGTEKLSGSITSGSVDFKNGTNSTAVFDPSDNSIKFNVDGYTQSQVDTKLNAKANSSDVYTKSQTYTKTETNNLLNNKADKSTTYTKDEVDEKFDDIEPIKTASGQIATFETNIIDVLQSLKCEINAKQDLHGYDHPWAGGAGKNKLNYDKWKQVNIVKGTAVWENNGVTLTATNTDCYTGFAPETFHDAEIPVSEGETVILSWEETTNKSGMVFIFPNGDTTGMVSVSNTYYKSVSYTVEEGVSFITFRFGVNNQGETISYENIQINKGSKENTWTPYANVCPINGYSSANITRCGVNLNDENPTVTRTTSDTSNQIIKLHIYLKAGVTYCFSCEQVGSMTSNERNMLNIEDESTTGKTYENATPNYMISGGIHSMTYTPTHDGLYSLRLWTVSLSSDTTYKNFMLEVGSIPSAFVPYNGQTYTVAFGQTVYGGVLDVTRGKLHVTHYYDEYDENAGWSAGAGNTYFAIFNQPASKSNNDLTQLCNMAQGGGNTYQTYGKFRAQTNGAIAIGNKNPDETLHWNDLNAFKADVALNHISVCYELATPFDIDLTPQQIEALLGVNNVWHDANGDTEVKYLTGSASDIKAIIAQTNLSDLADIPNPPTTDGTYRLKVTIANGKATYSWEEIT